MFYLIFFIVDWGKKRLRSFLVLRTLFNKLVGLKQKSSNHYKTLQMCMNTRSTTLQNIFFL